ncbi:hypothetical protein BDW74DRAFT_25969 [Aspergillus multicolor]|uniref:uncharacterized protein n=1 Tax=Aspergillus multicolor TaxID=41759 RepID=UPI003CCE058C
MGDLLLNCCSLHHCAFLRICAIGSTPETEHAVRSQSKGAANSPAYTIGTTQRTRSLLILTVVVALLCAALYVLHFASLKSN